MDESSDIAAHSEPGDSSHSSNPRGRELAALSLASLGVVYGDIGTSPLYAIRECFSGHSAMAPTTENVLGVLSVLIWSLTIIVSGKYVIYILRADNRGEGGILALMALALSKVRNKSWLKTGIIALGLAGAALLYGDGAITPAISVLSAVEGLEVTAPGLSHYIVPITLLILAVLFAVQYRGTGKVGSIFGPITLLWFFAIGSAGIVGIVHQPQVLLALNPIYAIKFFVTGHSGSFVVLGAIVLALTGAEALYTDMGHFGRKPIHLTWFSLVKPALILNYLGQGALLLGDPNAAVNPFYYLFPTNLRLPMVVLASAATVIASQALISGVYSLTLQASMLGYWPRINFRHTSGSQRGQIYVPAANWILFLATSTLVIAFASSASLAGAYGIAVTGTMVITTLLAFVVTWRVWKWKLSIASIITIFLLVPGLIFFFASSLKIPHGGWVPIAIAILLLLLMTTWKKGRNLLGARLREGMVNVSDFHELMRLERPARVPGTAVFMTATAAGMPPALIRNFEHNRVVHQQNVLLTVQTVEEAKVTETERIITQELGEGFSRLEARYGFTEEPNIPKLLASANLPGVDMHYVTYFFGREILLADNNKGMRRWRKRLFTAMARLSERATAFFHIPPNSVVEIGAHVDL
ncbi:MAG: potassium transporter Kup [Deltaproteobacteria bacterium]|nr:potassium transporter Kup [Deltaproteobacteria bacterium]